MPTAARPLARVAVAWALLAETVPLYPLYALLFADTGLHHGEIAGLLALWSLVGVAAEVPSGVLADRWSRRGALAAAGLLQAAGYAVWLAAPGLPGFAVGFALWGVGGALVSGALEALLYDGLAAAGAEEEFGRLLGRVTAVQLLSELPAGVAAALLFRLGGYPLVGGVSIAVCLAGALLATRLPEPPRTGSGDGPDDDAPAGYVASLRAGVREAAARPAVRGAVIAVALVGGVDGMEEWFPLLARGSGVATADVPAALLGLSVAGAAGSLLAGRVARAPAAALAAALGVAALAFATAAAAGGAGALVALGLGYGLHQAVLVVTEARLQRAMRGTARATVTSVAGLGTETAALALLAVWALGGLPLGAALVAAVAAALPGLLTPRGGAPRAPAEP